MSRFLAFAAHVESVDEAKAHIAEVGRKYHDARHVCWAYMVGKENPESMSNDNGEPSGTAGKPILGQINSFGLTDVAIAVVRYFGGIKLGTSGLIQAYRESARTALENAQIIECHVMDVIGFTFPYIAMNEVMKLVKQPGIRIIDQTFDNTCAMTVSIRKDDSARLRARLADTDGVSLLD